MSDDKAAPAPPAGPFATDSLPWNTSDQGRFSTRWQVLADTRSAGSKLHIGVAIEILEPGRQSCPFHYHMLEEEHILLLDGEVTLRLGEQRRLMKAGDFVSFPAGETAAHCLVNEGTAPCRYLVIGDNNPNEVCVYPDSNKIMVRAIGQRGMDDIFDMAATRDYWDGEPVGE